MKSSLKCLFFLCAGLLVSCGSGHHSVNKKLTPASVTAMQKGITTKAQVIAMLGNPRSTKKQIPISQPPGVEPLAAKYTACEIWAFWTDGNKKSEISLPFGKPDAPKHPGYMVIIYFDERGIVFDYETEGEIRQGRDG